MFKKYFSVLLSLLISAGSYGQLSSCIDGVNLTTGSTCFNNIITGVPFLNFPANPESVALGGAGIAISPSTTSISLNSSNLAFIDSKFGVRVSYTPWMRIIGLTDTYLAHIAMYWKLDKKQAIGGSFRYFSLGNIQFTNQNGGALGTSNPREFEALLSYNRKLSSNFAMGLSLKYIYSKLAEGQSVSGNNITSGKSIAGDLSFTNKAPFRLGNYKAELITGLAFRNLGPKISYIEDGLKSYLPANLGLGLGFIINFQENHKITFTTDLNRLMVPTPSEEISEGDPNIPDFLEKSPFQGMISSFGDAPDGLGEDFRENQYSIGIEYRYKFFMVRTGHFNEHRTKGNRKFTTAGIGFRVKGFGIDLSKMFQFGIIRKPYPENYRIAVSYDFNPKKKEEVIKEL